MPELRHGLVAALDRRTLADATRIEPDHVESIEHLVGQRDLPRKVQSRRAGTTGVHQQRSDPLLGLPSRTLIERERDLAAGGIAVVEGYVELGAPDSVAA